MAVLPILKWPDARLTQRCAEVAQIEDIRDLARDMLDTMYDAAGRGLAAPQVGVFQRLFVMDTGWKAGQSCPVVMINPDILWMSDTRLSGPEGCLSIPGIAPEVKRAERVRVRWTDLEGQVAEAELDGFAAVCVQHEFDHLDGIVTLMRLSPQARAAAEAAYIL